MTKENLKKYLETRRQGWPYEGSYRVERIGDFRFTAWIGDELAGLAFATDQSAQQHGEAPQYATSALEARSAEALDVKIDSCAGCEDKEAVMRMTLKSSYAEYGIGTELLHLLMEELKSAGFGRIRYEIPRQYYAYQIYRNLGFEVESQDEETVRFIWRRQLQADGGKRR